MARVAHVMSKTRNRSHIPLISQLKSLDKKPPLKLPRFRNVLYLIPPLLPEAIRCSVYISTHSALTRAHGNASVVRLKIAKALRLNVSLQKQQRADDVIE
jgi:hypothetical protein